MVKKPAVKRKATPVSETGADTVSASLEQISPVADVVTKQPKRKKTGKPSEKHPEITAAAVTDVAEAAIPEDEPMQESVDTLAKFDGEEENEGFMALDVDQDDAPLEATLRSLAPQSKSGKVSTSGKKTATEEADVKKPNVVYVGHIPHGFYEDQMAGFFGQFGKINRLRVSRNKKTGKAKHYAFIEFESPEVAAIVADCMHNYLLFSCVLQVKLVPNEKIHPLLWQGANKKFRKVGWQKIARDRHNKERTQEEQEKVMTRLLRSEKQRRAKLQAAGIEYDFEGYSALQPTPATHIKFSEVDSTPQQPTLIQKKDLPQLEEILAGKPQVKAKLKKAAAKSNK
eukprot:jgi/Mesen1/4350/ME000022S03635